MSNWVNICFVTIIGVSTTESPSINNSLSKEITAIITQSEVFPLTCYASKNGATGNPWKDSKTDKEGKAKKPRRTAGNI